MQKRYSSCPQDGKILEFYEGVYECVFVALHPFMKPVSIDIEKFRPGTYPEKQEIIDGCEIITWRQILSRLSLEKLSDIDIGLRTCIHGLKEDYNNHFFADAILNLCEKENIVFPEEGELSPLLVNKIFKALMHLNHEWVWVCEEFGDNKMKHKLANLITADKIPSHGNINTSNHDMLITTHWDSHCSFLCSSKDTLEEVVSHSQLEGFYCENMHKVYWGLSGDK